MLQSSIRKRLIQILARWLLDTVSGRGDNCTCDNDYYLHQHHYKPIDNPQQVYYNFIALRRKVTILN